MKIEKNFDSVKMMREIRDKLSEKFSNMNYEDQRKYIKEKIKVKAKSVKRIPV